MYRIVAETLLNTDQAEHNLETAHVNTVDFLKRITQSPGGNFALQSHEDHMAYVEEVVFEAYRANFQAQSSLKRSKPADRHLACKQDLEDIAMHLSGNSYEDIASATARDPHFVHSRIAVISARLTSVDFYSTNYFSNAYKRMNPTFKRNLYSGLLGVVKLTEPPRDAKLQAVSYETPDKVRKPRLSANNDGALSRDSVGQYMHSVSKHPLLNAEQEVDISKRIEAGLIAGKVLRKSKRWLDDIERQELEWLESDGNQAKELFINSNLRLVISIARKYRPREGMVFEDYIQDGNIGLHRAVEKFDCTKGYKFSTYATWWIKQAISRGIAEQAHLVRKPVHVEELIRSLGGAEAEMRKLGVEPTIEDLAAELGISEERVMNLQTWRQAIISLDAPLDHTGDRFGNGSTVGDLMSDIYLPNIEPSTLDTSNVDIEVITECLNERDRDIVLSRYGVRTGAAEQLKDIGKRWGISAERVRQLERDALNRLREMATMQESIGA